MRRIFIRPIILSLSLISLHISTTKSPEAQDGANFSAQRLDAWRILGPGGGGGLSGPAVSPHDPNLVLVASEPGAYISENGGVSWRLFNLRSRLRDFVFDPINPNVIYVATDFLWRSGDRGRTWNLVYPPPRMVTRLIMPDELATPAAFTAEGWAGYVTAFAIDPKDSKKLYLEILGEDIVTHHPSADLYLSDDRGAHWRRDHKLARNSQEIYVDPRSPLSDRTLYFVGWDSVEVRKAGVWKQGPPPVVDAEFGGRSASFSVDGQLTLYVNAHRIGGKSRDNLFISRDGGMSWKMATKTLSRTTGARGSRAEFYSITACPTRAEVAYASFYGLRVGGQEFHGVAKTTDYGASWQLVWKEAKSPAPNVHDAWITERFGTDWGEFGDSLGVAPNNSDICYRGYDGRFMRTLDGGKTWEALYSHRMPDGTYTTTGLDVTTSYGLFFDPFDHRIFISCADIGLLRSENDGQSWTSSSQGVPSPWLGTNYWLTFDPAVRGRVWSVWSSLHDMPRKVLWLAPGRDFVGGVCISDDAGKTWRVSNHGMPPVAATDILLDPTSPVNARVLYVTGFGRGIFKSVDGGKTWSLRNKGLPDRKPAAWRLARDRNGVLYLVVASRNLYGIFGNADDGALYRSSDGAEHWEKIALPKGVNGPNGLAIDPEDPKRLYLAAWGRNEREKGAVDGGIFLSSDGGVSWRNVLAKDQHIYDITIDPRDPRILYSCGFESSAWRSTDRGETWSRIKGYNFKWGHRVIPDPVNPDFIYITTFGGSVWYGPAAGDPHSVEDIVTPALAYGR